MNTLLAPLALTEFGQAAQVVVGAVIFVILFTVILTTLRRAGVFSASVNVTLAICVSLLAVIGIMRTFGRSTSDPGGSETSWLDFILLPYTAMAIAMLLFLLLLLLRRILPGGRLTLRRLRRGVLQDPTEGPAARARRDERNRRRQSGRGE